MSSCHEVSLLTGDLAIYLAKGTMREGSEQGPDYELSIIELDITNMFGCAASTFALVT
jgi:hypothetical protein